MRYFAFSEKHLFKFMWKLQLSPCVFVSHRLKMVEPLAWLVQTNIQIGCCANRSVSVCLLVLVRGNSPYSSQQGVCFVTGIWTLLSVCSWCWGLHLQETDIITFNFCKWSKKNNSLFENRVRFRSMQCYWVSIMFLSVSMCVCLSVSKISH